MYFFKGTLTDETVTFFMTNTPCGFSQEETIKVYAPDGGSTCRNFNVYTRIGGIPRDN